MLRSPTPLLLSDLEPRQLAPTLGHGVYRAMMQMVFSLSTLSFLFVQFISTTSTKASQKGGEKIYISIRRLGGTVLARCTGLLRLVALPDNGFHAAEALA